MAIPIFKMKYEGEDFYSPFSGKNAFKEGEPNEKDKTFLFAFIGDVGEWLYVSGRVQEAMNGSKKKPVEDMTPAGVCRRLDIPGAICFQVDSGWNGVNWIAFAPKPE